MKQNYIAGQWVDGVSAQANINPSDVSDTIDHFARADVAQLNQAVAAAKAARGAMRAMGLEARQAALMMIGNELMARADELGTLLSREEGKPQAEGKGEVYRAGQFFTFYAAEILRQTGETADSVRAGIEIDVRREPMGVVGVISPWNFPTAIAAWKCAPALAFGNCVVLKPAEDTPASAWALAEIISRAGFPEGAFNLVMGKGSEVGQALSEHPDVDAVTFTGSLATGKRVAMAAAGNLSKYQLELGSKNALLVMDDGDLDIAVAAAAAGSFGGTGQKCTCSSRLVVHEAVHDAFVERLVARMGEFKVGHALEPGTTIGPVVNEAQLTRNLNWLTKAKSQGAELLGGGERLTLATDGFFMSPGLLVNTTNDLDFNREEMFAPVSAVIKVGSYEEGLSVANDTHYGLTAGIITKSLARATHFRRNIETGCVSVNIATGGNDYHVPFGGRKMSSSGPREQGRAAVEFFTQMKTSYILAGDPE